jgi:hypothetical protein
MYYDEVELCPLNKDIILGSLINTKLKEINMSPVGVDNTCISINSIQILHVY